jgi:hypothetical protein
MDTGYFQNFYEFATMVEVNGVTRPMYFVDGTNVVDVHNFDIGGSGYIRKNGQVTFNRSALPSVTACTAREGLLEIRLPLRAVFAVPKSKLNNNGFSDDLLAMELIDVLHGDQPGVSGATVFSRVLRYETDRDKIYKEEVNSGNLPILELSYICIDFELLYTGSVECFKTTCY